LNRDRKRARFQLSPKITLCVEEVPSAYTASMGLFVACGNRHESSDQRGVTHLCEHLFFKGTSRYSAQEISKISERMGGELNAYTDRELTSFHADCPAEQIEEMLALIFEMLLDPQFTREDFASERDVVLQEIVGYEDSPEDVFNDLSLEVPFKRHPLGLRVGGTSKEVKRLDFDKTCQYIEKTFLATPWVLSVVSPLPVREIHKLVKSVLKKSKNFRFSKVLDVVQSAQKNRAKPQLVKPWIKQSEVHNIRSEQVQVAFMYPAAELNGQNEMSDSALASILGMGSSSALYRQVRETEGLVYHVGMQHLAYTDTGLMMGLWSCTPENLFQAAESAAQVCGTLSRGVSKEDFYYMMDCLRGVTQMSFDGIRARMDSMGRQEVLMGYYLSLPQALKELSKLRLENLNKAAKRLAQMPCFLLVGSLGKRELKQLEKSWRQGLEKTL
jgi:predicted Zn-dependent peptidase